MSHGWTKVPTLMPGQLLRCDRCGEIFDNAPDFVLHVHRKHEETVWRSWG